MKKELLAERARILNELDLVEKLLATRYQWTPEPVAVPKVRPVPPPKAPDYEEMDVDAILATVPMPILYSREADEWIASITHKEPFSVRDFRAWLIAKHGDGNINVDSLKGPMSRLEKTGRIVVVEQGSGRRPTSYRLQTLY